MHNKFYCIQLNQFFFHQEWKQNFEKKNPLRNSIERITLVKFKERLAGLSSLAVEWQ